jgi:hypothetical protein
LRIGFCEPPPGAGTRPEAAQFGGHLAGADPGQPPRVLIVTVSRHRARCIDELVARENRNGIRFRVRLLENVKVECSRSGG